jgi:hypothetical protein
MKRHFLVSVALLLVNSLYAQIIEVVLPPEVSKTPLDGRLLIMLSKNPSAEPRFQISDDQGHNRFLE